MEQSLKSMQEGIQIMTISVETISKQIEEGTGNMKECDIINEDEIARKVKTMLNEELESILEK